MAHQNLLELGLAFEKLTRQLAEKGHLDVPEEEGVLSIWLCQKV